MKTVFNLLLSHLFFPKEVLIILFESIKLYCLNLAFYLTAVITLFFLWILFGGEFPDYIEYTTRYFYNGNIIGIDVWRIHLAWFAACVLINLDYAFK